MNRTMKHTFTLTLLLGLSISVQAQKSQLPLVYDIENTGAD